MMRMVMMSMTYWAQQDLQTSGARLSAEPDQGSADEAGRAEDGAQVQRDKLRECHKLTHWQAGRGEGFSNLIINW